MIRKIYHRIRFTLSDHIYKLHSYFYPRQKWLTDIIPKTWCDKPELILNLNFAILVDFVENEKGLDRYTGWDYELENNIVSQEYVDNMLKINHELQTAYNYIKYDRKNLENQYNDLLYVDWAYKARCNIKETILKKDYETLHTIITYRESIWT